MADITHDPAGSQWLAHEAGEQVGHLEYTTEGDVYSLIHTIVDPAHGGKGIASQLVRTALDELRAEGRGVRPVCPYVVSWIEKHPDYASIVVSE